jgi:hypothetical protein
MKKIFATIFLLFLSFWTTSCRTDLDFEPSFGELAFSKDTVFLDTVFTNIGSSTYNLKVYNNTNKNISIPKISFRNGLNSKYRMNVDGMAGQEFENVEILANDSMFVFIEVTADVASANPNDFLYTDAIEFGTDVNFQKVELVTLIQDAYFIFPNRTANGDDFTYEQIQLGLDEDNNPILAPGSNLDNNDPINGNELIWNNAKPYVIYGYAKVPEGQTLQVNAGARVHFHDNSGLIVSNTASLHVQGGLSNTEALENEVIFEGDRLEPQFSETAGQWGTIWFLPGSTNNILNNLTIKNAVVGMLVSGNDGNITPSISMQNVQIYNCANVGILSRTGNISGRNVVVNNCGQTSLGLTFGGKYDFTHCTFANYWPAPNQTVLVLSNDNIGNASTNLDFANFKNCVFYGSTNLGIALEKFSPVFNYNFNSCLIKFIDTNNQFANDVLYDFDNNSLYTSCIIANNSSNNKPEFEDTSKNDFRIKSASICIGNASTTFATFADILGNSRNANADIGAYEFQ